MGTGTGIDPHRRGRRASEPVRPGAARSPKADQAIVDAALAVFAEERYEGLTIEAVAARAGVGKATISRRYPGPAELVFHAASHLTGSDAPEVDTGSLAGDLRVLARRLVHRLDETVAGRRIAGSSPRCLARPNSRGSTPGSSLSAAARRSAQLLGPSGAGKCRPTRTPS
jgi:AcrR family transcriptional regulator